MPSALPEFQDLKDFGLTISPVHSVSEAVDILLVRYKNKVAFADILNTEEFTFVKRIKKPRKVKRKESYGDSKSHSKV